MKLNILSDLHLGFGAMDRPVNDADVVVLAGDISRSREAVAWTPRFDKPVLYAPGNHEFCGSSIDGAAAEFERPCAGTPVHVLPDRELVIHRVRFPGSTLWTDFALFDDPQRRVAAKDEACRRMRDFSRIQARESSAELFTPDHAASLFRRHAAWFEGRLARGRSGAGAGAPDAVARDRAGVVRGAVRAGDLIRRSQHCAGSPTKLRR